MHHYTLWLVKLLFANVVVITFTCIFTIDVNECLDNDGSCSHTCINTPGSYHCECLAGYVLLPNNHDCEGDYSCYVLPCIHH